AAFRHLHKPHLHDAMRREALDRRAVELDLALFWLQEARNCPQRRTLAGTVAADKCDNLAFLNAQRNAAQRLNRTVGNAQVVDREQRHKSSNKKYQMQNEK